jgi:hypothetical protein
MAKGHPAFSIVADVPTQAIEMIAGALPGRNRTRHRRTNLRFVGFIERCPVHNPFAIEYTVVELQLHPLGKVAHVRANTARRRFGIRFANKLVLVNAILQEMKSGLIRIILII